MASTPAAVELGKNGEAPPAVRSTSASARRNRAGRPCLRGFGMRRPRRTRAEDAEARRGPWRYSILFRIIRSSVSCQSSVRQLKLKMATTSVHAGGRTRRRGRAHPVFHAESGRSVSAGAPTSPHKMIVGSTAAQRLHGAVEALKLKCRSEARRLRPGNRRTRTAGSALRRAADPRGLFVVP